VIIYNEQVVGKDDRLLEVETKRLDQGVLGTLAYCHILLRDLPLRLEFLVASQCSKSGSSAVQDVFGRSLQGGHIISMRQRSRI
jgi:hypothetical protein